MSFETKEYDKKFAKGLKRDPVKHVEFKAKAVKHVPQVATIPGKLDLRPRVSPCENQSNCGSCWDFSITKALRSAHMLVGKDPGTLAFNYLLNNCGPGTQESGCGGGDFPAGDNMLNGAGPWLESEDPYQQSEGRCKTGLKVAATALKWVLVGDGRNAPTFQELAQANSEGHMLSVDVDASSGSWAGYSGGIYNHNAGSSIDHMINMVGYDMETSVDKDGNALFNAQGQPINGDGYLILQNNWDESWGENGCMRSRWGMNAVAETAMYFVVDAPPAPPVPPVPPVPPAPPAPAGNFPYWIVIAGLAVVAAIAIIVALEKK